MHIGMIAKAGNENTGVGRYTYELANTLDALGHLVTIIHPVSPLPHGWANRIRKSLGLDLKAFFETYPVWANYPQADVYHLASQNLATLMIFHPPPGETVVTVHDIIPWQVRHDPELGIYRHRFEEIFDYLAMKGLQKVDAIISDSDYTGQELEIALELSVRIRKTVPIGVR